MSKEHYFNQIEFLVQHDEDISALLRKICKYYNSNGKIQDKLTISNPSGNIKRYIQRVFNQECIKSTYIDLKTFFEQFSTQQKEEWINKIFEITGIIKKLKSEEEAEIKDRLRLVVNRLGINFQNQTAAIDFLKKEGLIEKYDETALNSALKLFIFIIENKNIIDFSELGARVLNDSKVVREGTEFFNLVQKLLLFKLNSDELKESFATSKDIFELYNVISNPTSIKVTLFGPFVYEKNGKKFDFIKKLWENGESATLTMDNLKDVSDFTLDEDFEILTCENESPFNSLKRKSKNQAIIFTSGYPNSAVKKVLELLKDKREFALHWGDSDFAGYYIASIINKIIPVRLWRCDIESLKTKKKKLIKIDDPNKLYKIEQFIIKNPGFPYRNELLFTMKNGWLEQENW